MIEDYEQEAFLEPEPTPPPKSNNKFLKTLLIVCVASVLTGTAIGFSYSLGMSVIKSVFHKEKTPEDKPFELPISSATPNANISQNSLADVISNVKKAVVAINTVTTVTESFFNLPYKQTGSGSGIIFHEDDSKVYIVTNCHVINGANLVKVSVNDSEFVVANLIEKVFSSDVAVVSVEKSDLALVGVKNVTVARFGNSDLMRVGDQVIAIGNALGEGNTVTSGIISAKDKKITIDGTQLSIIQIDASINPGNSGGALINNNGEIIGINTAKLATYSVEGMGYSISSNIVKPIVDKIMSEKKHPRLGITCVTISPDIAQAYELPASGVFVNSVSENSNGKKYGIKRGDIITKADNKDITTVDELMDYVKSLEINTELKLHIIRNGENSINLKIKLEETPGDDF